MPCLNPSSVERNLHLTDEVGGITSYFLTVQDMDGSQLLDDSVIKLAQRDVNERFAEAFGDFASLGARRGGA